MAKPLQTKHSMQAADNRKIATKERNKLSFEKKYDHKKIESKWQKIWEDKGVFHAEQNSQKPKFFALVEFPYPSGQGLHVGHPRSYTALDIVSRKRRLEGYNVLYPIGWDAFGLPTENFAIKNHIHPAEVTKQNVAHFKAQLQALGLSFDWSREINTTDPKYFKWTQWIFLQLYKHGLAYKKEMAVNWCTSCKCVLANEEVVGGVCERCHSEGVVIPGARAAVETTRNQKVGVIGTDATVQSGMYTKVIQSMAPDIEVIEKACPLFVPLVEEGFKEHVVTEEVIEYYLESMRHTQIDAMILGCTHYPLLRSKIRDYLGEEIKIVNPAYETAMDLKKLLYEKEMANDGTDAQHSVYSFYVSDAAEKFRRFANTVMPFDVPTTNVVNIEEY